MQLRAYSIKYLYRLQQAQVLQQSGSLQNPVFKSSKMQLMESMNVIWVSNPSIRELHSNVSGIVEVIPSLENFDLAKYGLPPY
ncbi:7098_t:CDS:2 [Rhizophagus irregularis]|nr:7098_t:CDS:2 [Rhizophagus irregularis]